MLVDKVGIAVVKIELNNNYYLQSEINSNSLPHITSSSSKFVKQSCTPSQNAKTGKHSGPCVPFPQLKNPPGHPEEKIKIYDYSP